MNYKEFYAKFTVGMSEFKFMKLYEPDVFSSDEQKKIGNSHIIYPALFKVKKIEGEEPTDAEIKKAINEFNTLYSIFADHPIPKAFNPKTGEKHAGVSLKPFKLSVKNVLSAVFVESKIEHKPIGLMRGQKCIGIVTDVSFFQKFYYVV
jgi:hypothetical protein